jgi:general secretion pathway protein K
MPACLRLRPSLAPGKGRSAARRAPERGAALLIVILTIAVLTALTVDLAYNTRVSLQIAANARDELRATYMAKSAVNVSRLVLHFQQKLNSAGAIGAQALAQLGLGGQQGSAGGAAAGSASSFSFRLWEIIPVDSLTIGALFTGHPAEKAAEAKAARPSPAASFQAKIDDEERKVNVAQFAGLSLVAAPQLQRFLLATRDARYDVLFDREDENGNRFTRRDVAVNLKDWVDEDTTTSVIGLNPAAPFENGFGDENQIYQRGEDRYFAKNDRFDSLDELYLVGGVTDAFMAAFADNLTVYPDVNATININTADPEQMMVNVLVMSNPPGIPQPPLLDPAFPTKLNAAIQLARPLPFMTLGVSQLASILQALGVNVQPAFLQAQSGGSNNPFGTQSSTFTIHATGRAGDVEKSVEAVVTMDSRAKQLSNDLGRLIHWREE